MPPRIALITDSTCDIPTALRQEYNLVVVPLYIIWGDEQLRDGVDILPEDFYRRLIKDPQPPKTSQPTPQDFLNAYQAAAGDGAQEIVVFTISSAMSGTYLSAMQAKEHINVPVHVYDSRTNGMSLGWQVLQAARVHRAGGDAQAMLAAADEVRRRSAFIISLDTLEYLHRGGRIGGASRFIGTLINLKPQIYVDMETGRVEAGERVRTRAKALEALYRNFFKQVDPSKPFRVAVQHTMATEEAERLAERIRSEHAPEELFVQIGSPILGVHTGPGTAALAGFNEE